MSFVMRWLRRPFCKHTSFLHEFTELRCVHCSYVEYLRGR